MPRTEHILLLLEVLNLFGCGVNPMATESQSIQNKRRLAVNSIIGIVIWLIYIPLALYVGAQPFVLGLTQNSILAPIFGDRKLSKHYMWRMIPHSA